MYHPCQDEAIDTHDSSVFSFDTACTATCPCTWLVFFSKAKVTWSVTVFHCIKNSYRHDVCSTVTYHVVQQLQTMLFNSYRPCCSTVTYHVVQQFRCC